MAVGDQDALIDRHRKVLSQGQVLLSSSESRIVFDPPFVLASQSEGRVLEGAIVWVTRFAFLLSALIGTLVVVRAAPPLLGAVVGVWTVASICARLFARARRRQLGSFLLDFESGQLSARMLSGSKLEIALSEVRARTERSADSEAPVWLLVTDRAAKQTLRLGRGPGHDVDRVLAVLRRHQIHVDRKHDDP